jgi:hypothetical protein
MEESDSPYQVVFTFLSAEARLKFIVCLFGGAAQYARAEFQRVGFDRDRYTLTFLFWSEVSRRAFLGQFHDG